MRIPDEIAAFLESATLAVAGTRDRGLVPHAHRPSGFGVSRDGESVVCLFAEAFCENLASSLDDNLEIALTVSQAGSHETYQLKGRRVRSAPVEAGDLLLYDSCLERGVKALAPLLGFSEETLRENLPPPTFRVDFSVREIYDQTPGPRAGRRLFPPEDPP